MKLEDLKGLQDPLDLKEIGDLKGFKEIGDHRGLKEIGDHRGFREIKDCREFNAKRPPVKHVHTELRNTKGITRNAFLFHHLAPHHNAFLFHDIKVTVTKSEMTFGDRCI